MRRLLVNIIAAFIAGKDRRREFRARFKDSPSEKKFNLISRSIDWCNEQAGYTNKCVNRILQSLCKNSFMLPEEKLSPVGRKVLDKLESLEQLRPIVDRIDPDTTTVMTFGDWFVLGGAEHLDTLRRKGEKMPDFIILDWDGKPNPEYQTVAGKYGISIFPEDKIKSIGKKDLAAYLLPKDTYPEMSGRFILLNNVTRKHKISRYKIINGPWSTSFWYQPLPGFVASRFDDICTIHEALSDEESKESFLRIMKSIETAQCGYRSIANYDQYCHPIVDAEAGDFVIEGGLDDGASTQTFIDKVGDSGYVLGFEPFSETFKILSERFKEKKNVVVVKNGLWSSEQHLYLVQDYGGSLVTSKPSANTEKCSLIRLDDYIEKHYSFDKLADRTFLLKLDIEGSERRCLDGAVKTIRHLKPKLQIAIYHSLDEQIDLPLKFIKEYSYGDGALFYIGHHTPFIHETIFYAKPKETSSK